MRNPNLTPVVITDKRGRTTTVHRRLDKSGASKSALAEQAIINPNSTAEYERFKPKGQKAFRDMGMNGFGGVTVKNMTCIAMLDEPLLDRIVARCKEGGVEAKLWRINLAYSDSFNAKDPACNPRVLEQYREALDLYPLALKVLSVDKPLDETDLGSIHSKVDTIINSAERFTEHEDYDLRTMKAHMLASAIKPFGYDDDDSNVVETLEFIADNIDAVVERLPILIARGDRDAGLLDELLSAENTPLIEGVL